METPRKIILASDSPRRRELLKFLNIPFEVHAHKFAEVIQASRSPEEEVRLFARGKAVSLRDEFSGALIIGSDTLVEWKERKFGKPENKESAVEMLKELSGKVHRVLTGVSVLDTAEGNFKECLEQTLVKMRKFSAAEARAYVATGEPMGKAGAYAIQGRGGELVESIQGDYFNIVGLPLHRLAEMLAEFGVKIPVNLEELEPGRFTILRREGL